MQAQRRAVLLALAVTALALAVRGLFSLYTPVIDPLRADAGQYAIYGYNLSTHGVFSGQYPADQPQPDSYRAPGYPLLVAAAIGVAGTGGYYPLLLAANALLGALTCGLVVLLGALCLPLWGAALAGLLLAFSPHHISLGNYVLSETLFGFALTACLYLLSRGLLSRRAATLLGAGAFGALAWATNPVFAVVPVLVVAAALWHDRGLLRPMAVFLLPLALAIGGWQARGLAERAGRCPHLDHARARQLHRRFASGVHGPVPHEPARSGQLGEPGHHRGGRLLGPLSGAPWAAAGRRTGPLCRLVSV